MGTDKQGIVCVFESSVMTSAIFSSGASQYQSPLTRLRSELASEVSSGAISASDQSALSSALTDIDSALKS